MNTTDSHSRASCKIGLPPIAELGPSLVLLGLVLIAAVIVRPVFFAASNLQTLGYLFAFLLVTSLGQLLVVIAGGIDLSVGAVMSAALTLMVYVAGQPGDSALLGMLIVYAVAAAVGLINGILTAWRGVPAILTTLATMVLLSGAVLYITEGRSTGRVPEAIIPLGARRPLGIPLAFIIAVVLAVIVAFVLVRTVYGRVLYAVGANDEAAHYTGVRVKLVIASAFVIGSLLAVTSGVLLSGYIGLADRTIGNGYELTSIATVVLGGALLGGGQGTVSGVALAAAALASLDHLMILLGADLSYQLMLKALVFFIAAVTPELQRRHVFVRLTGRIRSATAPADATN